MAYIKNATQKQQGPVTTSGQSSVISANTTDPNGSNAQGTGWTDLKKYLDNNQGLGEGVAQAVTADNQGKIDSAAGKINEFQTKAATANSTGVAQNNKLEGYKSAITSDPTKIDTTAYRNDVSAGYQGVGSAAEVDGYTDASSAYGSAKDNFNNLKNDDWNTRASVVQNTYGKDNAGYSKGMGLLDTLVLQGDAKGKEGINNFVTKNSSFIGDDTTNALSTAKGSVQAGLDAEKNRWGSLLGSGDGSLNQTLAARKASTQSAIQSRQGEVDAENSLAGEKADVFSALSGHLSGIYGNTQDWTYDPGNYKKTVGDYSTDNDKATLDALANMGAGDYDKSLVTKSGAAEVGDLGDYRYDAATNKLYSRNKYDGHLVDMTKGTGAGSLGVWLESYLKGKGY